jgi:hypothetical protein
VVSGGEAVGGRRYRGIPAVRESVDEWEELGGIFPTIIQYHTKWSLDIFQFVIYIYFYE